MSTESVLVFNEARPACCGEKVCTCKSNERYNRPPVQRYIGNSDFTPEPLGLPVWNFYDESEQQDSSPQQPANVANANADGITPLGLPVWNFDEESPQQPAQQPATQVSNTSGKATHEPLGQPVWDFSS